MSIKTKLMTACAGVMLVGLGASTANATLTIDLRLADGTKRLDRQLVDGEIIDIDVYAIVEGAKAGYTRTQLKTTTPPIKQIGWNYGFDYADGIQSVFGNVLTKRSPQTAQGAVKPDLQSVVYGAEFGTGFGDSGASLGDLSQDLTGDGILDTGTPDGTPSTDSSKWMCFRAAAMAYYAANPKQNIDAYTGFTRPAEDPASQEFLLGKLQLFVSTATVGAGATEINWDWRRDASHKIDKLTALWSEDRQPNQAKWDNSQTDTSKKWDPGLQPSLDGDTSGKLRIGAPIVLGIIPEPMSMSVFALGAAVLGLRRTRR